MDEDARASMDDDAARRGDGAIAGSGASGIMAATRESAMAMTARELVERLNQIKASVDGGETPELDEALRRCKQRLKDAFGPDELKAALKDGTPVPTSLEEEVTTLTMQWMQRRA